RSILVSLLIVLLSDVALSQDTTLWAPGHDRALKFLEERHIALRKIESHNGFLVYYSCDSTPFLKKVSGDTIRIWTMASDFSVGLFSLDYFVKKADFGTTSYISGILSDTMVTVASMWQTTFINRHDSLFEIEPGEEWSHTKLIFHPNMFKGGRKKVTVSKRY